MYKVIAKRINKQIVANVDSVRKEVEAWVSQAIDDGHYNNYEDYAPGIEIIVEDAPDTQSAWELAEGLAKMIAEKFDMLHPVYISHKF